MGTLGRLTSDKKTIAVIAILIVALATAVRFYNIGWAFSSDGIDEGIMLERAQMVSRGFVPYKTLPLDQAPLGILLGGVAWGDVFSVRAVSAIISIIAVVASMEAARRIKGNTAMLITGALLALDFAFLRETRIFSLNGLSSSLLAVSILFFVLYLKKESRPYLLAAGLMVGASTSMKLFGVLGFVGMAAFLVYEYARAADTRRRWALDTSLLAISSAIPIIVLMFYLGPSEMIRGMVLNQGHRGFEPVQKLSFLPYFGTNLAYILPLFFVKKLWRSGVEYRLLLSVTAALVVFMLAQPLMYYHHLVMLSPVLSVLAGASMAGLAELRNVHPEEMKPVLWRRKGPTAWGLSEAAVVIGLLISAGLTTYGIVEQGKPSQQVIAEKIQAITSPNDWIVSGDPTISAYAERPTPPTLVNVAYSQYPDITLEQLESDIQSNQVSVVVLAYRLNTMDGLSEFLLTHGYAEVARGYFGYGDGIAIYTFNRAIEPYSFFVRTDIVQTLGLPVT